VTSITPSMCPHCGKLFARAGLALIPIHADHGNGDRPRECPGSGQLPRNPESDRRPLWNGKPNPHLGGADDEP